jgi:hypothetical protein
VGKRREKARYAIPVYEGVALKAYKIHRLVPGGSTFDPLDFVMFGLGIFIAIGLDYLFSRVFSFWSFGDEKVTTGV